VGTVPELDTDKVSLLWSGTSTDLNSNGGSVIGQTLELGAARGENGVLGGVASDYGGRSGNRRDCGPARHVPLPIPFVLESERVSFSCQSAELWTWLM